MGERILKSDPPGTRIVNGTKIVPYVKPGVKIPGTIIGRGADLGKTTGDKAMDQTLGLGGTQEGFDAHRNRSRGSN